MSFYFIRVGYRCDWPKCEVVCTKVIRRKSWPLNTELVPPDGWGSSLNGDYCEKHKPSARK